MQRLQQPLIALNELGEVQSCNSLFLQALPEAVDNGSHVRVPSPCGDQETLHAHNVLRSRTTSDLS